MQMVVESGVRVAEIAKRLGVTSAEVETEARRLGVFLGADWSGELAMSQHEAAGLVTGALRRETDHHDQWAAHVVATEAWEAERQRVYDQTVEETRKTLSKGRGTSASMKAAWDAGQAAAVRFERQNPAPSFQGTVTASPWARSRTTRVPESVR